MDVSMKRVNIIKNKVYLMVRV